MKTCSWAVLSFLSLAAFSLTMFGQGYSYANDLEISWSVKNNFRLFGEKQSQEVEALMQHLAVNSIENSYDEIVSALVGAHAKQLRKANYDWKTQRYSDDYLYPKSYLIQAELDSGQPLPGKCEWSSNYEKARTKDCSDPQKFKIPKSWLTQDAEPYVLKVKHLLSGRQGSVIVEIVDQLIVGFGDSFGSGEGNPDVPADFSALDDYANDDGIKWWTKKRSGNHVKPAKWWDKACHRSLLSYPTLAALKIAAMDKHKAITFVHLNCSGAGIYDGILRKQVKMPGSNKRGRVSQLQALELLRCRNNEKDLSKHGLVVNRPEFSQPKRPRKERDPVIRRCATESPEAESLTYKPRPVDYVFLSIGGNDIGFAGVVTWAVLPTRGRHPLGSFIVDTFNNFEDTICPSVPNSVDLTQNSSIERRCKADRNANNIVKSYLPAHYQVLEEAFSFVSISADQIIQTQYPNPTLNAETNYHCGRVSRGKTQESDRPDPTPALDAALSLIPSWADPNRWEVIVRVSESDMIDRAVLGPLNETIKSNAKFGWRIVGDDYANLIKSHGWCAVNDSESHQYATQRMALPRWSETGWLPAPPSNFETYAKRQRWFRTPNDSLLSQFRGKKYAMQGSMHPTLQAHTVMADAVVRKITEN